MLLLLATSWLRQPSLAGLPGSNREIRHATGTIAPRGDAPLGDGHRGWCPIGRARLGVLLILAVVDHAVEDVLPADQLSIPRSPADHQASLSLVLVVRGESTVTTPGGLMVWRPSRQPPASPAAQVA